MSKQTDAALVDFSVFISDKPPQTIRCPSLVELGGHVAHLAGVQEKSCTISIGQPTRLAIGLYGRPLNICTAEAHTKSAKIPFIAVW